MDTKDPRFISAYNELVTAFFRFINVVNPAPSRSEQIRLICDSMTCLVDMLKTVPEEGQVETEYVADSGSSQIETKQGPSPMMVSEEKGLTEQPVTKHANVVEAALFTEKRYAKEPTLTGEGINKFLNRQLKKEDPFNADGDIDPEDYIFIVEFDPEIEKGVFYLNKDVPLANVFNGNLEKEVVSLKGNPTAADYNIVSNGKIKKSTGGWEIIEPLVITK